MRNYAKSIALYERTRKHLAGGVSSNVRYASTPVPLFFERGEGVRLYDVDGNIHIDYVLGNGPAILGHAPKPVIDAVARSLTQGQVYAGQHPRETELAERLCGLLPGAEVVRFATSGTEAVLMAMRLARAFTGRTKIVKFEGHYHGWSDQAYISARPPLNEAGPVEAPVPVAGSPGMPKSVLDDVVVAGWNDLDALTAAFDRHPGEIAAVMMHGGTYNGNVQSMAAAIAALDELERDDGAVYRVLEQRGSRLMQGLASLAAKHRVPMRVQGLPAIFQTFFTTGPAPRNYRDALACDRDRALAFHCALQEEGIRINQMAKWFLSTAHDDAIIDETLAAADRAMATLK